jgi:chromosome segregation ATPase
MSDLPGIADELYGLAPTEFTAARNARAKEATAQKDKNLAEAIRRLPKPAASAWVVNALVRERGEEVGEVLALGAAMREAQAELDRDELAKLGQQRRRLVSALARSAGELAASLGQRVSATTEAEVEQTLHAAMADERAARALLSGRLLRALESVGLEEVDLRDAVAAPEDAVADAEEHGSRPIRTSSRARDPERPERELERQRDLERARRELEGAEQRVGDQAAELASFEGRIARTARRRELLDVELTELRDQLHGVERDIGAAVEERRTLDRERDRVRHASAEAERVAERARARLDRISE